MAGGSQVERRLRWTNSCAAMGQGLAATQEYVYSRSEHGDDGMTPALADHEWLLTLIFDAGGATPCHTPSPAPRGWSAFASY